VWKDQLPLIRQDCLQLVQFEIKPVTAMGGFGSIDSDKKGKNVLIIDFQFCQIRADDANYGGQSVEMYL
jgi:hypothetical protein